MPPNWPVATTIQHLCTPRKWATPTGSVAIRIAPAANTTPFIAMQKMTPSQQAQLPYTLLLDPDTGRAAAYNSTNKLITELASKELVAFALANARQDLPFDVAGHAATPTRRPPPSWATAEVQERMRLIWIQRPASDAPAHEWLEIPAK